MNSIDTNTSNTQDILLINLHSIMRESTNYFSNLGLASIEPYLHSHGMNCRVINIPVSHLSEIDTYVHESEVFGISVMDHLYVTARELTRRLQSKTVIWGGWTVTALPEFILKENPEVNYLILQEGEKRLLNLLRSFKHPDLFEKIDGIAYRNEEHEIVIRPPREFVKLDDLPIPSNLAALNNLMFVELARGCHGRCRYCQEIHTMRFKSAQKAAEEIQHWYKSGYRDFYLGDANSIANGPLLLDVVHELERRNLSINLMLVGRPDDVVRNAAILEKIFASTQVHLSAIEVGIEANTQHALDLLGRKTTPEINHHAMNLLLGFAEKYSPETRMYANMILFSHFDMTLDDFVENVRFIGTYQCSKDVMMLQLYGIANTPIWHDMKARGFRSQEAQGAHIFDYPFSDRQIDRLFHKLIRLPLQQITRKKDYSFIDYATHRSQLQYRCYRQIMEFYQSGNILESLTNLLNSCDDHRMTRIQRI